jgi:hypothetical protein
MVGGGCYEVRTKRGILPPLGANIERRSGDVTAVVLKSINERLEHKVGFIAGPDIHGTSLMVRGWWDSANVEGAAYTESKSGLKSRYEK